jgi:hypothetical protein
MVLYEKFASGFHSLFLQLLEERLELRRVKIIDGKSLVHGCLDRVGYPVQPTPKLILQTG